MKPAKHNRKFFDPRPPGPRRKDGHDLCQRFNAAYPIGTPLRVWPLHRDMDDCSKETVVKEPGAFLTASGHAVVKIPGDCIALTHVEVLDRPSSNQNEGQDSNG